MKDSMHSFAAPQRPLKLVCCAQNYAWGRPCAESLVAKLLRVDALTDARKPFAELWIGAHPKAPSCEAETKRRLDELIKAQPEAYLGPSAAARFEGALPFLLKVLSVGQPLSIQVHPDRSQAKLLHDRDPERYPDGNHKPEIALAVTQCRLLFGLRPIEEFRAALERCPELREVLGPSAHPIASARDAAAAVLRAPEDLGRMLSRRMVSRLIAEGRAEKVEEQLIKTSAYHPDGDSGLFFFYLMNLVELQPFEALFLPPGALHAYLEGDLVECLANSDNVIRAGLTPKPKDAEVLLEIADWSPSRPAVISGQKTDTGLTEYPCPAEEFRLASLRSGEAAILSSTGPSIVLALEGESFLVAGGTEIRMNEGDSYFISPLAGPAQISVLRGVLVTAGLP